MRLRNFRVFWKTRSSLQINAFYTLYKALRPPY